MADNGTRRRYYAVYAGGRANAYEHWQTDGTAEEIAALLGVTPEEIRKAAGHPYGAHPIKRRLIVAVDID